MDETFKKLINPQDARGMRGQLARGKNVYRGGLNSPTPINTNSRTGKVASKKSGDPQQELWTRLAQLRLKGLI